MQRAAFLPEGVEEMLPEAAWQAEALRRRLLDAYRERGYGLILPPLVEHLDSLLVGAGEDLEEQTFRFIDPASGRMLGVRADMTPQAARIAATHYPAHETVRLCYLGSVLRTHPDAPGGARAPRQVGCEIFGESSLSADLEILQIMVETLALAGVARPLVDLGHVGIYAALVAEAGLTGDDEQRLFDLMQRKAVPELESFLAAAALPEPLTAALHALVDLYGGEGVLDDAAARLPPLPAVVDALDALRATLQPLRAMQTALDVHIDLAELRGYRYQTGLSFAAFAEGGRREIARGGRYDGIGSIYGVARPATGFSADLNELLSYANA